MTFPFMYIMYAHNPQHYHYYHCLPHPTPTDPFLIPIVEFGTPLRKDHSLNTLIIIPL